MISSASVERFHPANADSRQTRRLLRAVALFLIAPLVAEFLLGNMSVAHLGMLAILAPLYGGGALLTRELVRKTGRGWPSIFSLALAYGVLEEAFLMQSLFNPDFLGKHLSLLQPAFIPRLGIGAWYTVFVLTLHTVWSIPVPIALVEAVSPRDSDFPWLNRWGDGIVAVAFVLACISIALFTRREDPAHFIASRLQFISAAATIAILIALAFALPKRSALRKAGRVPYPWILGFGAFTAASAFLLVPRGWGWWAVIACIALDTLTITLIWHWSRRADWRAIHSLALAGGAAMAYAVHAFVESPSIGDTGAVTRIGNLIFAVLAAVLIAVGAKRTYEP